MKAWLVISLHIHVSTDGYSSLFEQGAEWLLKAAPCPPAQLNALWLHEGSDEDNTAILDDACRKALKEYVSRRREPSTSVFVFAALMNSQLSRAELGCALQMRMCLLLELIDVNSN